MASKTERDESVQSDRSPSEKEVSSHLSLPSQVAPAIDAPTNDATAPITGDVAPHGATGAKRVDVRVGRDGSATVGRKRLRFSRSLAGALVTVPTRQKEVG